MSNGLAFCKLTVVFLGKTSETVTVIKGNCFAYLVIQLNKLCWIIGLDINNFILY